MKIMFSGGSGGWSEYVMEGTLTKPRDKNKIEVIDGDIELTKNIYESDSKVKERYTRIVLGFKGKQDKKIMKKVYKDFKENLLKGYENNEYNISAVAHFDTSNDHIHICLPKLNLKTNNHNAYYFDKTDRYRINLIRDYLIEKYDLLENQEKDKELIKEDKELTRLEKWRKEHKQPKISLKRKRSKDKATEDIKEYLTSLLNENLIENLQETKNIIKDLGLEIVNEGYDKPSDSHYLTIMDEQKNKLKIKGELFNEKFYKSRKQDTRTETKDINNNQRARRTNTTRIKNIKQKLDAANSKRAKYIKSRNSRAKGTTGSKHNLINSENINDFDNRDSNRNNSNDSIIKNNSYDTTRPDASNSKYNSNITGVKNDNNTTIKTIQGTSKNIKPTRTTTITRNIKNDRERLSGIVNKISKSGARIGATMLKVKKEIDIFKEDISLTDFALNCDFEIDEKKSTKTSIVLKKDNEKIIISKDKLTNHNTFFNLETGKGGTIIDFYKKYVNAKKQFWQILADLRKYHKTGGYKYNLIPTTKDILEVKKEVLRLKPLTELNIYLKSKKISQETLDEFSPYIHQDNRNNTIFIHKHFSQIDKKIDIETCGIERKNKDFKQQHGEKGLWGKKVGNSRDFFIFESPVDALSFYQLHKREGNYISTGGNMSKKQIEDLQTLLKQQNPDKINLCVDNDIGGDNLADRLNGIFPYGTPIGVKVERIKPFKKDFNEDLIKQEKAKIKKQKIRMR